MWTYIVALMISVMRWVFLECAYECGENIWQHFPAQYFFARRIIAMPLTIIIVVYVLPVLICSARVSEKW